MVDSVLIWRFSRLCKRCCRFVLDRENLQLSDLYDYLPLFLGSVIFVGERRAVFVGRDFAAKRR